MTSLTTVFWSFWHLEDSYSVISRGFIVDAIYNVIHLKAQRKNIL